MNSYNIRRRSEKRTLPSSFIDVTIWVIFPETTLLGGGQSSFGFAASSWESLFVLAKSILQSSHFSSLCAEQKAVRQSGESSRGTGMKSWSMAACISGIAVIGDNGVGGP